MAPFTKAEIQRYPYIWQMFRDGPVALVHCEAILAEFLAQFKEAGYSVQTCDAAPDSLLVEQRLRGILGFPKGAAVATRLDAFRDYLGEWDFPEQPTGVVVLVRHVQMIHEHDQAFLRHLMDIFAREAHYHLLSGRRLLLLLQSDDRDLHPEAVGGRKPCWNPRERGRYLSKK